MPTVIANEIIGVQPMTGPVGQIHTLRVRYADNAGATTAGSEARPKSQESSSVDQTDTFDQLLRVPTQTTYHETCI